MSDRQLDIYSISFDNMPKEYRPYAMKIMKSLYSKHDYGLSIREIRALFNNDNKTKVDTARKYLENQTLYIEEIRHTKHSNEKRYILNKEGKLKFQELLDL